MKLKSNLLIEIISPNNTINKYSKAVLNLKAILKLETNENFKIPLELIKMYDKIIERELEFINGIPLTLIEKYFYTKADKLNGFINIEYRNFDLNIRTNELYLELEKFYEDIFILSSCLASFYNLEIKINSSSSNNNGDFV